MEVIEDTLRYVKSKNLKINRWVIFHPYANFNCLYLKIGQCDLFPVLLECITWEENNKREWKPLIDSYTKWAHDLCLGYSSLTSAKVSPNMGDFVSQGLWPFPNANFNFLIPELVEDNWGKTGGVLVS